MALAATPLSCASPSRQPRQLYGTDMPLQGGYAIASWYGREFQGRPTASGENFNMFAYTCAHKEFPFGTRLLVTNVLNNASVRCVVNDRGPFVEGRDIDLSYAAAKDIGIIGPGTGKVLLEIAGRDETYIRTVSMATNAQNGPFAIQVGAYADNLNAIRMKVALSPHYPTVYIQEALVNGKTYYRVRIGDFGAYGEVLSRAESLAREGYEVLVVQADLQ